MITACTISPEKFSLYDARSVGPSFLLIASVSWGWQQKRDAANLGIDADMDMRCVCKLLGRSHRYIQYTLVNNVINCMCEFWLKCLMINLAFYGCNIQDSGRRFLGVLVLVLVLVVLIQ